MIKIFGAKIWMNFSQNDIFSGRLADRQAVQCRANRLTLMITNELFWVDGFCFFQFPQSFQRWLFSLHFSSIWTDSSIQKDQLFTSHFAIYLFLSGKSTTRFEVILLVKMAIFMIKMVIFVKKWVNSRMTSKIISTKVSNMLGKA